MNFLGNKMESHLLHVRFGNLWNRHEPWFCNRHVCYQGTLCVVCYSVFLFPLYYKRITDSERVCEIIGLHTLGLQTSQVAHIPVTDSVLGLFLIVWETYLNQGCYTSVKSLFLKVPISIVIQTCEYTVFVLFYSFYFSHVPQPKDRHVT
jgi:hypothetical protein